MRHSPKWMAIWPALMTLTWFPISWAQDYRDSLTLPSLEINRNLITYAQAMDLQKISRTLPVIKPLTDALKTKFGIDVESEIRSALVVQDPARLLKATQQLVYFNIKDLMDLSLGLLGESTSKARAKMKAAYLNYLLLSPFIQKVNLSSDQLIKNRFRAVDLVLGSSSPYSREPTLPISAQQQIRQLIVEIETELAATLALSN